MHEVKVRSESKDRQVKPRTYIIEERKGQGAKPETVKTASPPLSAPHRRLRRPFPPRRGEKTAMGRFWGEKKTDQGQFYARSIIKVHEVAPRSDMFFVEFLSPAGGANQPAGLTGEVMPWTRGKNWRFCSASWGFVRKITERKNGPIQIHRKNGFGVRFTGSAPATARPPDRQER